MNREHAITFTRLGELAPETVRGFWADTPAQAEKDFRDAMESIKAWNPAAAIVNVICVRELPNPARKYLDKDEAAFELHMTESGINQLIADGYLPRAKLHARWLCSWEELERAKNRQKVA